MESEAVAVELAVRCRRPVEATAFTTENIRIWAQPDGTRRAQIHAGTQRVKRDGRWATVDLTLVGQPDGSVRPRVHPRDLVLTGARSSEQDHDLATIAVGGERVGLGWLGRLPQPSLSEKWSITLSFRQRIDLLCLSPEYETCWVA